MATSWSIWVSKVRTGLCWSLCNASSTTLNCPSMDAIGWRDFRSVYHLSTHHASCSVRLYRRFVEMADCRFRWCRLYVAFVSVPLLSPLIFFPYEIVNPFHLSSLTQYNTLHNIIIIITKILQHTTCFSNRVFTLSKLFTRCTFVLYIESISKYLCARFNPYLRSIIFLDQD